MPAREQTVKRLRLSKALTIPDGTTVAAHMNKCTLLDNVTILPNNYNPYTMHT